MGPDSKADYVSDNCVDGGVVNSPCPKEISVESRYLLSLLQQIVTRQLLYLKVVHSLGSCLCGSAVMHSASVLCDALLMPL